MLQKDLVLGEITVNVFLKGFLKARKGISGFLIALEENR